MSKKKCKILLVDDHVLIREGMRTIIEDEEVQVVAEASNGLEALKVLTETEVDVVLVDINMPEMNGIEFTQKAQEQFPHVKVIALTMMAESHYIKNMLEAGAVGYILKNSQKHELKEALETVLDGGTYYGEEVGKAVLDFFNKRNRSKSSINENLFTPRELEVLQLVVKEYDNQQIAEELFISVRTVEAHKRNMIEKAGVKNLAGLIVHVVKNGIVSV